MELTSVLLQEANNSPHGESFKVVESNDCHRLGVGYRLDEEEFFVEILVKVCQGDTVDLEHLKEILENLRNLESLGYLIRCEDDNSLYAEKIVNPDAVPHEVELASEVWNN